MTRRRIIATAVTVAALACVLPVWEDVWLWLRYEEGVSQLGIAYHQKRVGWIPGHDFRIVDQQCFRCRIDATFDEETGGWIRKPHECWNRSNQRSTISDRLSGTLLFSHSEEVPIRTSLAMKTAPTTYTSLYVVAKWSCTCPTCHPERTK